MQSMKLRHWHIYQICKNTPLPSSKKSSKNSSVAHYLITNRYFLNLLKDLKELNEGSEQYITYWGGDKYFNPLRVLALNMSISKFHGMINSFEEVEFFNNYYASQKYVHFLCIKGKFHVVSLMIRG